MIKIQDKILEDDKKIIIASTKVIRIGNHASQQLNIYFKKLQYDLGCTYIFYIYENLLHNKKIIYSSSWKWQNLLVGEKLINDCPVFKAGVEGLSNGKKSIILPWNHIHCKNSKEKDITLLRSEFNIANGIGISHTNGCFREGIGLGADIKDNDFYQRVISNNLIYAIMKKIRLLTLRDAKYNLISQKVLN
ncbi:MAG TPA: hypothetical protein VLI69_00590 [Gammaproteobacteria bacterium]|nr:hypothetical protein [Gammaproteobacteria bacterium]